MSALMIRNGAEIASAIAAAHVVDGEFDLLDGGHAAERFIRRMIISFIGECVNAVELFLFKGERRWILNHDLFAVALDDRLAAHRVVLVLLDAAGARVCEIALGRFCFDFLKGLAFHGIGNVCIIVCVNGVSRAADIVHHGDELAFIEPLCDLHDLMLTHAEHQKIRIRIHENGGAHGVIPIVIVGKTA